MCSKRQEAAHPAHGTLYWVVNDRYRVVFSPTAVGRPETADVQAPADLAQVYDFHTSVNSRAKFCPRIFSIRPDFQPRWARSLASVANLRGSLYSGISVKT